MAGKANVLKQLFIQIGLIGAKTAVKDLLKVDKQTEKTGESAQKATAKTNRFSESLGGLGMVAKKTGGLLRRLGGPIMKGLTFGLRGAVGALKMVARGIKSVGSSILRVIEIAAGIQLSNLFSRVGQGIRGFATSAFDLAAQEQDTRQGLRTTFGATGNAAFADKFLKAIDRISERFGSDTNELAKAFRGTSIPIKKLVRVAEVVAKLQVLRPDVNARILAGQIQNMLFRGDVDETLKAVAPQLLSLSREDRMARGLESLEKTLKNVGSSTNATFSFRSTLLRRRFEELKRTFGRPILTVLTEIFGELLAGNKKADLTDSGNAVAQLIRTFWNAIGGTSLAPLINKLDKFLAFGIKWFGIAAKDIFDFLTGAPSALAKIFFPNAKTQEELNELGISDLIGILFEGISEKIKKITGGFIDLVAIKEGLVSFFNGSKVFFSGVLAALEKIRIQIRDWSPFGSNNDAVLPKKGKRRRGIFGGLDEVLKLTPEEIAAVKKMRIDGKNPVDATNDDIIQMNKNFNALPQDEQDFINGSKRSKFDPGGGIPEPEPDLRDQGAINFNTDIKITTQQPANIVRNQLASQMALIGNQGRLA